MRVMARQKSEYYIDNKQFTLDTHNYNVKANPIKFFNEIFDFHKTRVDPEPKKDDTWFQSVNTYFEYKVVVLERSKAKREANAAELGQTDIKDFHTPRLKELEEFKTVVMSYSVVKPMIVPIVPDSVALGIMTICEKYGSNYRYFLYTAKEDMIATGVEKCLRYIGNFSMCGGGNAMSYFTQICKMSFFSSIKKEKEGWEFNKKMFNMYSYDKDAMMDEAGLNTFD